MRDRIDRPFTVLTDDSICEGFEESPVKVVNSSNREVTFSVTQTWTVVNGNPLGKVAFVTEDG